MSEFLKGNFKPAKNIDADREKKKEDSIEQQLKKEALNSIGGSMVYVERTPMEWDGN